MREYFFLKFKLILILITLTFNYNMSIGHYLKELLLNNSIFLFIIYQIKTQKFSHYANFFTDRLIFFLKTIPIELTEIQSYVEANYLIVFQFFVVLLSISTFSSINGRNGVIKLINSLLFFFVSFVIFHPLHPENRIEAYLGIRKELMLSVGILIVRIMNLLESPNKRSTIEQVKEEIKPTN